MIRVVLLEPVWQLPEGQRFGTLKDLFSALLLQKQIPKCSKVGFLGLSKSRDTLTRNGIGLLILAGNEVLDISDGDYGDGHFQVVFPDNVSNAQLAYP